MRTLTNCLRGYDHDQGVTMYNSWQTTHVSRAKHTMYNVHTMQLQYKEAIVLLCYDTTICSRYDLPYPSIQYQYCTLQDVMHGKPVQYSTVQYSTLQYSTVQYSTVQYSISTAHC